MDLSAAGAPVLAQVQGVMEVKRLRGAVRGLALQLPTSLNTPDAVAGLRSLSFVEDVEREGIVTVQIANVAAAGVPTTAPIGLLRTGLARLEGNDLKVQPTVTNATSVSIAIVDTGVDSKHPDILLAGGKDFTPDNDYGLDGNGHGTHVAGIIGALNNGAGVVGAVPGAPIWSLKVLSASGQGTTTGVIDALNWVADNGRARNIRVVNLSLSGPRSKMICDAMREVVAQGITVIAAAGNNGMEISSGSPSDCSSALVVTAMADYDGKPGGKAQPPKSPGAPTTPDDTAASFSNYAMSRNAHVVAAPGVHVLSTVPAARCGPLKCTQAGPYAYLSGTSMAAPLVSGMAALCYNSGACAAKRSSSAGALYTSIYNAARADRGAGFVGDPSTPLARKFYGYLATNTF
ncbi:peptidase S8/S53 subtilisin kexin sedolisin [Monoraphidium neglectum]|uniref:Peptidase S8/S53 subtilisin kexin sedolisin n=1 Tax=Monoraphidium neglectum TaxID=145388 RepID=A0A0D2KB69_9CHLO|nr:peptidase S8/S53 subtilisin kexin sedolisin [Monoraphidium neglectum]KIZ07468.1 peptidase S8/S53 subtilisin kexin sedolisin [Monoraphidium neglectum]|eukprot:XP_013906487.1 peptidase S8/S53 subtilisin kexin sedolisin [Monoraphidium neglectum]